jgi:hypothetical protein
MSMASDVGALSHASTHGAPQPYLLGFMAILPVVHLLSETNIQDYTRNGTNVSKNVGFGFLMLDLFLSGMLKVGNLVALAKIEDPGVQMESNALNSASWRPFGVQIALRQVFCFHRWLSISD